MKSLGDPEEGLQVQKDSFSLANVVPQMQRHHAPIWAKLEDECLEASRRLGTTVGVIVGVTGIDFMPELRANDEVETKSEARWFLGNTGNVSRWIP